MNSEKEVEAKGLFKSELILEREGIKTAIMVADAFEKAFKEGKTFKTAWNSCYKANIGYCDFMGTVIHLLVEFWGYGAELKSYYMEELPFVAKFIGLV